MKNFTYFFSGVLFAIGLGASGMADPRIVQNFLDLGGKNWSPGLLVVLSVATLIYGVSFLILRRREKTFLGIPFGHPPTRPLNKRLFVGSLIFGLGWGILGICPGPALVNAFYLGIPGVLFLGAMFGGFEIEKRLAQ